MTSSAPAFRSFASLSCVLALATIFACLHAPRREGDEDVVGVRRRRGDEGARAVDPGGGEHPLVGGVPLDAGVLLLLNRLYRFLRGVDDYEREPLPRKLARDMTTDAPVAAHDDVVAQL